MTQLITLNQTTSMLEETLAAIDAAGRITVVQTTPASDNELVTRAYVLAQGGAFLTKSANLSDVGSAPTARSNLGWTGGVAGLAAMNVLGTAGARTVTDWTAADAGGTGFVKGAASATGGPVAATAFVGQWVASDAANGVLTLVGLVAGAYNVWTRRRVAGTWDQWTQAYDNSGYALLAAANIFTQGQTISHATAAALTLLDSDALVAGTTPYAQVKFQATDGGLGAMGFNASKYMSMTNSVGNISLNAATAGSFINFDIGGSTRAQVDPNGAAAAANTIIIRSMGDARYLQLAPSPLTTAQNVTATGIVTFSGIVRGITPVNANDFVTKTYADSLIGGGGASGITQDQADALYVNVIGDTMNGVLTMGNTFNTALATGKGVQLLPGSVSGQLYIQAASTATGTTPMFQLFNGINTNLRAEASGAFYLYFLGVEAARLGPVGTAVAAATTILTREKGDARYLVTSGVEGDFAKVVTPNTFANTQTIANTFPILYLDDTDGVAAGKIEAVVGFRAAGVTQAQIGFATTTSGLFLVNNINGDIRLYSSLANSVTEFFSGGSATANRSARIEPAGTTTTDAKTVMTREKGDARFAAIASDEALKDKIETSAQDACATLDLLRPVTFEWKDTEYRTGSQLGLIAQEVQQIIPSAVISAGGDHLGLDPLTLISVLVKAVQELTARVKALEA